MEEHRSVNRVHLRGRLGEPVENAGPMSEPDARIMSRLCVTGSARRYPAIPTSRMNATSVQKSCTRISPRPSSRPLPARVERRTARSQSLQPSRSAAMHR